MFVLMCQRNLLLQKHNIFKLNRFCRKVCFYSKSTNKKITEGRESSLDLLNQAPNRSEKWSQNQMPKSIALSGARFETINIITQPNPKSAIELIKNSPIIKIKENVAVCDGGGNQLGHPKIFINLVIQFKFYFGFKISSFFRTNINQLHVHIVGYAIKKSISINKFDIIRILFMHNFIKKIY